MKSNKMTTGGQPKAITTLGLGARFRMRRLALRSAPYVYGAKVKAFFKGDRRFAVGNVEKVGDDGECRLKIRVNDAETYLAALPVIAPFVDFGTQTVCVDIVPANKKVANKAGKIKTMSTRADDVAKVLVGNPAFDKVETRLIPILNVRMTFAMFKPAVLQFDCDNIGSPYGLATEVYEDAARSIFKVGANVLFATSRA